MPTYKVVCFCVAKGGKFSSRNEKYIPIVKCLEVSGVCKNVPYLENKSRIVRNSLSTVDALVI